MNHTKIFTRKDAKGLSPNGVVRFDMFNDLYTSPKMALWELRERRKDPALKKAVRKNLGPAAETLLKKFNQPRAVLFRQVGTPTHETLRFLRMAKQMGLKPLILEYHGDKFVSAGNRYKRSLGKMPIYQYTGSDGIDSVKYHTILDFPAVEGRPLSGIRSLDGGSLIDFHHHLLSKIARINVDRHTIDLTSWLCTIKKKQALSYYEQVLNLFLRDGILFESFVPFRSEARFTHEVIVPSINQIKEHYGIPPLIVRLLPEKEETRLFWDSFPRKSGKFLGKKNLRTLYY